MRERERRAPPPDSTRSQPALTLFISPIQAIAEAKRTEDLRKQLAEEREKEEFEAMAAGAGGKRG